MIELARETWLAHADLEEVLAFIRRSGGSKNDCITIIKLLGIVPKKDAKRTVHNSDAWQDRKESDEQLHDDIEALFNEWDQESK